MFFKFYEKSVPGTFLIFYIKLQQLKCLRVTEMIFFFFRKNLVLVFCVIVAKNEFFKLCALSFPDIFVSSDNSIKAGNLAKVLPKFLFSWSL